MANATQILPFATGVGANVYSPTQLQALGVLAAGFQNGTADVIAANTIWRQSMFSASMVALFTATYGPNPVNDDGNLQGYLNNFVAALGELFIGIPDLVDNSTTPNLISITTPEPVTAYAVPMSYFVRVANTNILTTINNVASGLTTVSVNSMYAQPLTWIDGSQLLPGDLIAGEKILINYDDLTGSFQLLTPRGTDAKASQIIHYGSDTSLTANHVIAAVDSAVVAWSAPTWFGIMIGNKNTGAATFSVNGLTPVSITKGGGTTLVTGDLVAGTVALMVYDGTECQLINPQTWSGAGGGGGTPADWNDITGQLAPYWLTVKSISVATPPISPTVGDAYIIPSGATGAWSTNIGKVCQYTTGGWVYRSYPAGSLLSVTSTQTFYEFDGTSWGPRVVPSPGILHHFANC